MLLSKNCLYFPSKSYKYLKKEKKLSLVALALFGDIYHQLFTAVEFSVVYYVEQQIQCYRFD